MPVRTPRRLDRPAGPSLHDRLSVPALSWADVPDRVARVERDHPELIVERDGNILSALVDYDVVPLVYAFESDRAFVEHFPAMLERLLPALRRALGASRVRFRLSHSPSRPLVEPVLKKLWFTPQRGWLEFTLDRAGVPKAPLPSGVKVRDATPDDAEAMTAVDRQAFPNTPMAPEAMRDLLEGGELRGLVATRRNEVVAISLYALYAGGDGYLATLATAEAERGRGIGAALVARTARRLFAEGARHVRLRTEQDNAGAIRFYIRFGFRQTAAGRDYVRPTDAREVERMKSQKRGTLIKFGGWR